MQRFSCRVFFSMTCVFMAGPVTATFGADTALSYSALRAQFVAPDHARWGEVPLWWWEGDRLSKERITWQLDTLAAKGVKAVCPIQRSPARCAPSSFTPEWWSMFQFVHRACAQRGMRLWAYDQIGYGHYGWLEKAAAKSPDPATARIDFQMVDVEPRQAVQRTLPKGKLLGARAYPLRGEQADDGGSRDITDAVAEEVLRWTAPAGRWRVVTCVAVPAVRFRLSEKTTDTFIDMLYGEIERRCGANAMGHSFAGVFQDEHPPTPRDAYTDRLGTLFRARHGYELGVVTVDTRTARSTRTLLTCRPDANCCIRGSVPGGTSDSACASRCVTHRPVFGSMAPSSRLKMPWAVCRCVAASTRF